MPFEKGKPKTGGRQTGSPNKVTADIKSRITALIDDHFDTISDDMATLEPKDRIAAYQRFMEYVLPKQREQKVDLSARLGALDNQELNEIIDHILTR